MAPEQPQIIDHDDAACMKRDRRELPENGRRRLRLVPLSRTGTGEVPVEPDKARPLDLTQGGRNLDRRVSRMSRTFALRSNRRLAPACRTGSIAIEMISCA